MSSIYLVKPSANKRATGRSKTGYVRGVNPKRFLAVRSLWGFRPSKWCFFMIANLRVWLCFHWNIGSHDPCPSFKMIKFCPYFRVELLVHNIGIVRQISWLSKLRCVPVGDFNPSEKYARQIESFPHTSGWKKRNIGNHLVFHFIFGVHPNNPGYFGRFCGLNITALRAQYTQTTMVFANYPSVPSHHALQAACHTWQIML